jgi:hypothetical protein
LVQISDGAPAILIVVFRGFSQSLETNAGIDQDRMDETESLGIFASSGPIVPAPHDDDDDDDDR